MLKIGITGGVGSGKSVVRRMFSLLGIPVYDTDHAAKELMNRDPQLRAQITALLGDESYSAGGLERRYVASKVFNDPELLGSLNAIVHPAVRRDFTGWTSEQTSPYVVVESAIMFDSGFDALVDAVVAVAAPDDVRIGRVIGRDGADRSKAEAIMANQMPQAEVVEKADYVVDNDGVRPLWPQILELDEKFRNEAGKR